MALPSQRQGHRTPLLFNQLFMYSSIKRVKDKIGEGTITHGSQLSPCDNVY